MSDRAYRMKWGNATLPVASFGLRAAARRAFTLMEMLVAMAIMSVLAMSIYSSLHIAFNAREAAERALEPTRILTTSLQTIADELRNAVPVTGMLSLEFLGTDDVENGYDSDSILFYNTAGYRPWPDHESGFRRIEFVLADELISGDRVLLRRTVSASLAPVVPEPEDMVICGGVRSFNVRYYDGSSWVDSWDSASHDDSLPYAVEITLELQPRNPQQQNERGPMMTTIVSLPVGGAQLEEEGEGGTIRLF